MIKKSYNLCRTSPWPDVPAISISSSKADTTLLVSTLGLFRCLLIRPVLTKLPPPLWLSLPPISRLSWSVNWGIYWGIYSNNSHTRYVGAFSLSLIFFTVVISVFVPGGVLDEPISSPVLISAFVKIFRHNVIFNKNQQRRKKSERVVDHAIVPLSFQQWLFQPFTRVYNRWP